MASRLSLVRWGKKNARRILAAAASDQVAIGPRLEMLEPRVLLSGTAYVIDSLLDTVADDGHLTLREAILAANTNAAVNEAAAGSSSETDNITFTPSLFASGHADLILSGTELAITGDLSITGPGQELLAINADQKSRVFYISGSGTDVAMEGLTVTGGYVDSTDSYGGGLFVLDSSLTLANCTISGNTASGSQNAFGGGLYVKDSNLMLTGCTINGNTASSQHSSVVGGGLYLQAGNVTLAHCTISGNVASGPLNLGGGGGLILNFSGGTGGTATLTNSTISENSTTGKGGGMWVIGSQSTTNLTDCTLSGNSAASDGGMATSGTTTLTNCIVVGNSATYYGGGLNMSGTSVLTHCIVSGNVVLGYFGHGGGLYLSGPSTLTNCIVSGNAVVGQVGRGGGMEIKGTVTLTNSTVSGNSASTGGGLCVSSGTATLQNTIVALNTASAGTDISGSYSSSAGLVGGDPKFIRNFSAGLDGLWRTEDDDLGDLHLRVDSPCINAGNNDLARDVGGNILAVDLDGHSRFSGGQTDIGAYEAGGIRGDFNGDWSMTLSDINPFKLALSDTGGWQAEFPGVPLWAVDPNGDGVLTLSDIETFRTRLAGTLEKYVVDSLLDVVASDGYLTLREAILAANTNMPVNEAPAGSDSETDRIVFDPALFAAGPTKITLWGTQLSITGDLSIAGPGQDLLSIDGAEESRVFYIGGFGTDVVLDNLTIAGGYVAKNNGDGHGGGVYADGVSVTLTDCTFGGNKADVGGGGLFISTDSTATLTNCIVSGNAASVEYGQGGGMEIDGSAILSDCTVSGNLAYHGGGLEVDGTVMLTNCVIAGNAASGKYGNGGGLFVYYSGTATLSHCMISDNWAGSMGGGIRAKGPMTLTDCTISRNRASNDEGMGGGLYIQFASTLNNCTISENSATYYGGGLFVEPLSTGSTVILTNCVVSGNSAANSGGGLYVYSYNNHHSTATLINCTVSGNWALVAGGGGFADPGGLAKLNNTIVAENTASTDADIRGPYTASSSFIGGDPEFIRNPSAGADGAWGTGDDDLGNLHLRSDSACLNAGIDALAIDAEGNPLTTDIEGSPRIRGPRVDIGAYELAKVLGDFNGDWSMTLSDVNPFKLALNDLAAWQAQYPGIAVADVDPNGDGVVTLSDVNPFKLLLTAGV
ncbi:MAG: right-handed parallel beta-helix repeat-containing protein [Phycisphaeraceae bacterium]|nr:right-handed parallel beta-helix repeat-containing protein [Phycisphaeraceae bacterium]